MPNPPLPYRWEKKLVKKATLTLMALVAVTVTHVAYGYLTARTHVMQRAALADRAIDSVIWGMEWTADAIKSLAETATEDD